MEAEYFPETSLHFYQSARLYTLESVSMHQIIKEYVSFFFLLQLVFFENILDNVTCKLTGKTRLDF
jgi:hypothetical protein